MKNGNYTDLAKAKVKEFENKLIDLYNDPNEFRNWLKCSLKFTQYSYFNQMLIYAANPQATYVATSARWEKMGIKVLDFHPINILRPLYAKYIIDKNGVKIYWKDMTKQQKKDVEDKKIKLYSFLSRTGCVPVFDISQTDATEEQLFNLVKNRKPDHDLEETYQILCEEYEMSPQDKSRSIMDRYYDFFSEQFNSFELSGELNEQERSVAKECYIYAALDTLGIDNKIIDFNVLTQLDKETSMDRLKALSKQIESLVKVQIAELSQYIL